MQIYKYLWPHCTDKSARPRPEANAAKGQKAARCDSTGPRARNQPSMNHSDTPDHQDSGTTPPMTVNDDSCGCSPELACFQHYLEGARGLPAVVPVSHAASDVDWEAHR